MACKEVHRRSKTIPLPGRLKLSTMWLTASRSNQLSYGSLCCSRRCFAWLADIDAAFAWQARCLWHWAGSSGVLGRVWRRGLLHGRRGSGWHWCGRRGTSWHRRAFCVAGVALMASSGTGLGVALGDIDGRFAWRAWRLVTLTYLLCGRCGAWWH